jgi:hypothetical protein
MNGRSQGDVIVQGLRRSCDGHCHPAEDNEEPPLIGGYLHLSDG